MKKYLLWIVGGVVGLVVVVGIPLGITFYVVDNLKGAALASSGGGDVPVDITKDNVVKMAPFVTNLADEKPRYISVTVEVVLADTKTAKEKVDLNMPVIRDAVISLLSSKKSQEVSGEAGSNTLKNEILSRINTVLPTKPIKAVLITDLVVQY